MARVLIVGGGCRGLGLVSGLVDAGHAVRVTTRSEQGRAAIEEAGAQCWIGDPDRIASLRLALDGVTVACWLLGTARGGAESLRALHDSRLRFMLGQLIDSTVRGFVYEAGGTVAPEALAAGTELARAQCSLNAIPLRVLEADPVDPQHWRAAATAAISSLLEGSSTSSAGV